MDFLQQILNYVIYIKAFDHKNISNSGIPTDWISGQEFRNMFYANPNDKGMFYLANIYKRNDPEAVRESAWGLDMSGHLVNFNTIGMHGWDTRYDYPSANQVVSAYALEDNLTSNIGVTDAVNTGVGTAAAQDAIANRIVNNWEEDLCVQEALWSARSKIQVRNLLTTMKFRNDDPSPEESGGVAQGGCMKLTCARRWDSVQRALKRSTAESLTAGPVNLFIDIRVTNGNTKTKDVVLRIKYTVKLANSDLYAGIVAGGTMVNTTGGEST